MTQEKKQKKVELLTGLLKAFFRTQYDAKLRAREPRTQEEADLATEILAEEIVNLI